jgi:hypothetical protein
LEWPARERIADRGPYLVLAARVGLRNEQNADGEGVLRLEVTCSFELQSLRFLLEERLRDGRSQARAVAGRSAHAATVFHGFECEYGLAENLGGRFPVTGGQTADPAGVATDLVRVEEFPAANPFQRTQHVHLRSPGVTAMRSVSRHRKF